LGVEIEGEADEPGVAFGRGLNVVETGGVGEAGDMGAQSRNLVVENAHRVEERGGIGLLVARAEQGDLLALEIGAAQLADIVFPIRLQGSVP